MGVVFAVGATVPDALAEPSGFAGLMSWGFPILGVTYGALIGAVFGVPTGAVAFGLLVIGWAAGAPRLAQGVVASAVVTASAAAVLFAIIGPDVQTVALIGLAAVASVGGIAILFAIDTSLARYAQRHPRIR